MASILASVLGGYALDKIGSAIGLAKGGKIQKTGLYKLHKGEVVVPSNIVSKKAPKTTSQKVKIRKGVKGNGRPKGRKKKK